VSYPTHKILIFILLLNLIACKPEPSHARIYDDETIIAVMIDLYTAEAAMKDVNDIYLDSLKVVYRTQIEEIHDVDINKVEADIAFLQKDLKLFNDLNRTVKDSISMMQKKYTAKNRKKLDPRK